MKKVDKTYEEFLKQKHSKINTPHDLINGFVKKATGSKPIKLKRLIVGEVNEVYDVTLESSKKIIVRISSNETPRFFEEAWAINKCREFKIPVPKVLAVYEFKDKNKTKQICIEEKLEGVTIDKLLKDLNNDEIKEYAKKAGETLSEINSIPIEGFGIIDKDGKGQYRTNIEYTLTMRIDSVNLYEDAAKNRGLDQNVVSDSIQILEQYVDVYKNEKSFLLHGDISTQHLFFENNQLTGIIDFENAAGGDPVRDIAYWDYYTSWYIPTEFLIEGYTNKSIFKQNFELKIHLYRLHMGLGFFHYYNYTENINGIDHCKKMFEEDLKYFKTL